MVSELIKTVCRQYNIIHKTITPYNSQSNGLIERFNRVIDQELQRRNPDQKKDWDNYLSAVVFAYLSVKQETTKQSPFFMMYGYEPNTPFDNSNRVYDIKSANFEFELGVRVTQQIFQLNRIRTEAVKCIQPSQKNQVKRIDKMLMETRKNLKPVFSLGDQVLLYRDYRSTSWSGKIEITWDGIFVIQRVLGNGTYYLKNLSGPDDTTLRRVHGNRLKIYSKPQTNWNAITQLHL